ncbi:hypothetical protein QQ045_013807 [Rhodiola kirilowii]
MNEMIVIEFTIEGFPTTKDLDSENLRHSMRSMDTLGGQVTNSAYFRKSFYNISSGMDDKMRRNKLAYAEGGSKDEEVFVYAQCMDDLNEEDCSMCFAEMRTYAWLLPFARRPRLLGWLLQPTLGLIIMIFTMIQRFWIILWMWPCGDAEFDNEEYIGDVKEMLAGLKTNAPDNNGYAALQEAAVLTGQVLLIRLDDRTTGSYLQLADHMKQAMMRFRFKTS